jgi:antitoxin CptB
MKESSREHRLRRIRFRAWHRGTREADLMIGGFVDRHAEEADEAGIAWIEAMLEETDVDVMAWAMGKQAAPSRFHGPMLERLQALDYVARAMK